MKSENTIIVQCKQLIKIKEPSKCLFLPRSWKKHSSDRFIIILFNFFLSVPSKVIIIVIQFMFLGINTFSALLGDHFKPHLMATLKRVWVGPKTHLCLIVIQFMFLGINTFWALLGDHFKPHLMATLKWVWVGPKTHLCLIVIQCMFLGINTFWALLGDHFKPHLMATLKWV